MGIKYPCTNCSMLAYQSCPLGCSEYWAWKNQDSNIAIGAIDTSKLTQVASDDKEDERMDDLISRQAVLDEIEIVCFSKAWSKFRADNGSNGTRDYIINYIKQLPPVQSEQKWIPCKERLPESNCKTILVTGKMKYASEKEYEYFVDCAFVGSIQGTPDNFSPFDFETWNDWYEGQDEYYILAWMPLPEPWKEESENK